LENGRITIKLSGIVPECRVKNETIAPVFCPQDRHRAGAFLEGVIRDSEKLAVAAGSGGPRQQMQNVGFHLSTPME
jgi:hypothetical protein